MGRTRTTPDGLVDPRIARPLGEDRRTIGACLPGERTTGVCALAVRDSVEPLVEDWEVLRRRGVSAA